MATKNDKGVTKTTLPIDSLNTKAGTQLRALDTKVAGRYCEDMQDGDTFPAVTVYSDGTELWLVDGFHRWHASVKAGFTEISAEVHEGKTLRDALFAACAANHGHGLQRNYADIAKSVRLLLRDPEWSLMSDRAISEHVRGISHTTVGKFRTEELGEGEVPTVHPSLRRPAPVLGPSGWGVRTSACPPSWPFQSCGRAP